MHVPGVLASPGEEVVRQELDVVVVVLRRGGVLDCGLQDLDRSIKIVAHPTAFGDAGQELAFRLAGGDGSAVLGLGPLRIGEPLFEQPGEELTKGRLTNISSGGAAVEVQGGEACTLAVGDTTTIRLAFEEGANLLSLSAEIRRCELSGKQATIGLRFTGPFDQDLMDQVSSYVLERLASEF